MAFEFDILNRLQTIHHPVLDKIMLFFTHFGDAGVFWVCLAILLLIIPKTRKTGVIMGTALVLNWLLCNALLKNLVGRIRPYDVNTLVEIIARKPADYSFPSGHTSVSFAGASALYLATGNRKAGIAAMLLACLIAFSRLYLYVHYPTDVLGGLLIGLFCGYMGYVLGRRLFGRKRG